MGIYRLAAESAGITYKSLNEWNQKGQTEKSGKYFEFSQYIQKCNADAAKVLLKRINEAVKAGDTQMCTWILERRFPAEFGRKLYKKIKSVSDNNNENIEINVKDADEVRKQILAKFDRFCEL